MLTIFGILLPFILAGTIWILVCVSTGSDPFYFTKPKVYLLDAWGGVKQTRVKHKTDRKAFVSYFFSIGSITLNEDGTVSPRGRDGSTYLDYWAFTEAELANKKGRYEA